MKNWIRERLIELLFALLGNYTKPTDTVAVLFTGKRAINAVRQKNWQRALSAVWQNKGFIDFLFYQAESDKENAWKGKVKREITQGARVRTLFIIYQAQKAHKMRTTRTDLQGTQKDEYQREMKELDDVYNKTVDIK